MANKPCDGRANAGPEPGNACIRRYWRGGLLAWEP
jgi:hypothetical protein